MKALIIASHPDDEVLGCGGTLKKISNTHETHVLFLTDGCDTRYGQEMIPQLRNSADSAAKLLGVNHIHFEALPNQQLETIPIITITKLIEGYLEKIKPQTVFTHHPGDLNRDHRVCFEATLTATRPIPDQCVKSLFTYFVPSSSEWGSVPQRHPFEPNYFIPIENEIETKIEAMNCYTSETRQFPHPRSPEGIKSFARTWGISVGIPYAEAFTLIRSVNTI